jgi:hypothetical protein
MSNSRTGKENLAVHACMRPIEIHGGESAVRLLELVWASTHLVRGLSTRISAVRFMDDYYYHRGFAPFRRKTQTETGILRWARRSVLGGG